MPSPGCGETAGLCQLPTNAWRKGLPVVKWITLIALELGGSNRVTNLWPEPYEITWNAHVKDRLENRLHELVCAGRLDLATAQRAIATDWIEAYKRQKAQAPSAPRRDGVRDKEGKIGRRLMDLDVEGLASPRSFLLF